MKTTTLILVSLLSLGINAQQLYIDSPTSTQDSLAAIQDSLTVAELDSLENATLDSLANAEIPSVGFPQHWDSLTLDNFDFQRMEWAMSWLDTTHYECIHDTARVPDSVYIERLQRMPCIIELPYNDQVRRFIERYVGRGYKQVGRLLRMSEYYFPMFEDALDCYCLPMELKMLPIIESALNPQARSHAGACGLWQFMTSTGKHYGLEINSLVDERMDPYKATDAACRFLQSMYRIYGDWTLVIASYNCGAGNVNKAIHRAGGKRDFWSIYPYLPRETRNYVPIFIAANYAMTYAEEHGICKAELTQTMLTDTLWITDRLHLQQVAEKLDIQIDELRRLNPQYRYDILPGGKYYTLCIPAEKTAEFIAGKEEILAHRADELINNRRAEIEAAHKSSHSGSYTQNGVTYYKVKRGDNLGSIAKRFHCTVKQLKQWNGLKSDSIREGQKLKIGK